MCIVYGVLGHREARTFLDVSHPAPYQTGLSTAFGSQVAYAESNVICFMNYIVEVRTNRYAEPLGGIAGHVPYFGLHKT
ncbi:MAG: aconitase X [Enterocloster aldenensis]